MIQVDKKIEVIALFDEKGIPTPLRFKMENDDESTTVIKIEKVLNKEKVQISHSSRQCSYMFKCRSVIEGVVKNYEIMYDLTTCIWSLYRI